MDLSRGMRAPSATEARGSSTSKVLDMDSVCECKYMAVTSNKRLPCLTMFK